MNYRLNSNASKGIKERLYFTLAVVFVVLVVSIFISFFSGSALAVARPIMRVAEYLPPIARLSGWFQGRHSLVVENERLNRELVVAREELLIKNIILNENIELKRSLGRADVDTDYVVATILARPNRTPYDTIIIDAGAGQGIFIGDYVLAGGSSAVGIIEEVYARSAKVKLFSAYGTQTDVLLGEDRVAVTLTGHGGGNFFIELPKDVVADVGDVAVLPGISPRVVATVGLVKTGNDTALQEATLITPVNLFELDQLFVVKSR